MILYFLRHGASDPPESAPDEARQLTDLGRLALRRAGLLLRRIDLRPDVVLCSPRHRAIETVQILQDGGLGGQLIVDERLSPGGGWSEFALALADHSGIEQALLVGHEPALSRSVQLLSGAAAIELGEGGLCRLEFSGAVAPAAGALTLLLHPALYGVPTAAGSSAMRVEMSDGGA